MRHLCDSNRRFAARGLAATSHSEGMNLDNKITDLLSDLMHTCNMYEVDFEGALRSARINFWEESALDSTNENTGAIS